MYKGKAWDQIYMKHFNDAPWMSDACIEIYSHIIDNYLPGSLSDLRVLDYGCGSGKLTYRLKERGAIVDFAEISRFMIEWLRKFYNKNDVEIYEVEYPQQLKYKEYDIILAWMFFCNIDPDFWDEFLNGFYEISKPGSVLIVGGWDKDDPINIKNNYVIKFTNQKAWPINQLPNHLGTKYVISSDDQIWVNHPFYDDMRAFRCYKLIRKK